MDASSRMSDQCLTAQVGQLCRIIPGVYCTFTRFGRLLIAQYQTESTPFPTRVITLGSSNFVEKMLVRERCDVAVTGVSQLDFVKLSYNTVSYNCMYTT